MLWLVLFAVHVDQRIQSPEKKIICQTKLSGQCKLKTWNSFSHKIVGF